MARFKNYKNIENLIIFLTIIITLIILFFLHDKYMHRIKKIVFQEAQKIVITSIISIHQKCYLGMTVKSMNSINCPEKLKLNEFSNFLENYLNLNHKHPFDNLKTLVVNKNLTNCIYNTEFHRMHIYINAEKMTLKTCNANRELIELLKLNL